VRYVYDMKLMESLASQCRSQGGSSSAMS